MTAVPRETRDLVVERAGYCCERCGRYAEGGSVHHRSARRMGGSKDPAKNDVSNLLLPRGSGTTECHGEVESKAPEHYAEGWLVRSWNDPAAVPIKHHAHGLVWLTPHGTYEYAAPEGIPA